jgi:hypothetical protein
VCLVISLILSVGLATVGNGPQGSDKPVERLAAMRAFADGVTMEQTSVNVRRTLERLAEPIYRFDDPARRNSDGTVWAWGRSGRPAAVLTLSKYRSPEGRYRWLAELTSLAPGAISATVQGNGAWQPSGAGVLMQKFPKAPLPAEDATKRLRQMKELVRQIRAYELFKPRDHPSLERYELRVLPQPVHRYADANSGLIDGGMFIISYGLNPEVVLLVEARREGSSEVQEWYCGFGRIAIAEIHVHFDNKEIWSHKGGNSRRPDDTYLIFTTPVDGE